MTYTSRASRIRTAGAFSLAELLIVLSIIAIVAAVTLPGIVRIFNSGAESQSYNVISSQLASARAYAVQHRTYAGLHFQMADDAFDRGLKDRWYSVVVRPATDNDDLDPDDDNSTDNIMAGEYIAVEGFPPRALPFPIAVGGLTGRTMDSLAGTIREFVGSGNPSFVDFSSCTVLFDPAGRLVTNRPVCYAVNDRLFNSALYTDRKLYLWDSDHANDWPADCEGDATEGKRGVSLLMLYDISEFRKIPALDYAAQADYLTRYGKVLAINVYTGQLMGRN